MDEALIVLNDTPRFLLQRDGESEHMDSAFVKILAPMCSKGVHRSVNTNKQTQLCVIMQKNTTSIYSTECVLFLVGSGYFRIGVINAAKSLLCVTPRLS